MWLRPGVQPLDLALVGVEADHLVPRLGKGDGERQADVSEPHDPDLHRRSVGGRDCRLDAVSKPGRSAAQGVGQAGNTALR